MIRISKALQNHCTSWTFVASKVFAKQENTREQFCIISEKSCILEILPEERVGFNPRNPGNQRVISGCPRGCPELRVLVKCFSNTMTAQFNLNQQKAPAVKTLFSKR